MTAAKSYADALLELANEAGCADEVYLECGELLSALVEQRELLRFFTAPSLSQTERNTGIDKALAETNVLLKNTVKLLCDKREGRMLPDMLRGLRAQYQSDRGIEVAHVTTATRLSAATEAQLKAELCSATGKIILLEATVDPAVLGGIRLMLDGKRYDSTLQARLESMKQALNQELTLEFSED